MDSENNYTADYYESHLGVNDYIHNDKFINANRDLADNLIKCLHPSTVLDVGCACGHLVSAFRDIGIKAYGTDSSSYALDNVRKEHQEFFFRSALPNLVIPDPFPKKYDLVTCIEVIEHIKESDSGKSILALTRLSDTILFSSTPDDFDEPTHINVHPISFWASEFAKVGFYPDMTIDLSFGPPQFVLFRKKPLPSVEELFCTLDAFYKTRKFWIDLANERLKLLQNAYSDIEILRKEQSEHLMLLTKAYSDIEILRKEQEGIKNRFGFWHKAIRKISGGLAAIFQEKQ